MGKRRENETTTSSEPPASEGKPRSGTLKGGMDAREMAQRSVEARRARAAERAAEDEHAALTFRQRLGVSLSRLTQDELDAAVRRMATDDRPSALAALARMADQAFGKPQPEEEAPPEGDAARALTRGERSALIARLLREDELDGRPAGEPSDPRDAPPHPRD